MDLDEKIDLKNAVTLVIKGFLYFRCVCPRGIVSDRSIKEMTGKVRTPEASTIYLLQQ